MNTCSLTEDRASTSEDALSWDEVDSSAAEAVLDAEMTPSADEVEERFTRWQTCFEILNPFQEYELRQMVTETLRIERCQSEERALVVDSQVRARTSWDADRMGEVFVIASKLARNPGRWRAELVRTSHGTSWMVNEWKNLRRTLHDGQGWDTRQKARALDLLGVPPLYRTGRTEIDLPVDELDARIAEEIERLESRLDGLSYLDAFLLEQAENGLNVIDERRLWAIRRYEAGCHRRYDRLAKLLRPKQVRVASPTTATPPKPVQTPPSPRFGRLSVPKTSETKPTLPKASQTEQLPLRSNPGPEASAPASTAAEFSEKTRPKAPPTPKGNRRERRKAAAMARRGK